MGGHVLYIGGFELPDKNAAAHRVISNGKALKELGYDVTFVGMTKERSESFRGVIDSGLVEGFRTFDIAYPVSAKDWLRYLTDVYEYLHVLDEEGDITHVVLYNFPALPLYKMIRLCRRRGVKCYADVTEWYSSKGRGLTYAAIKGIDTFFRMRVFHFMCDGLIVISSYLSEFYSNKPHIVIPPLVDISEEKWANHYEKSMETISLVYAGSPGRKDRIDLLVEALLLSTRDIRLDVVGITLDEYLAIHNEHAEQLRIEGGRIRFHGRVPHLVALDYIKKANYSCFFRVPDRVSMAGFPTKFVEAVTLSTPVLTNNTSDLSSYADGSNALLVSDIKPSSIASALNSIPADLPVDKTLFDFHNYVETFKMLF